MITLKGKNKKIAKIWVKNLSDIDPQTITQIKTMLELPKLFGHIAIMPDAHVGKGAVVGAVVATEGIVVPNIVGVDIGCGVSGFCTGIEYERGVISREFWLDFKTRVSRLIPTGFNFHKSKQNLGPLDIPLRALNLQHFVKDKASYQIGTLGGGNHFIESLFDENNIVWLMVHSGSRHTGLQIATYYNKLAKDLNEKAHVKTSPNLNLLRLDDQAGRNYLHDMKWAIDFALENRWRILEVMVSSFATTYQKFYSNPIVLTKPRETGLNIHHNFASLEKHFGENVVIHRKGATQAYLGQTGIIPGSMGTPSYIVKGLGNPNSYMSCSHGAGRKMSRTRAKKEIDNVTFYESLKYTFTKASFKLLDEAPGAYKNIDEVIENQKDLIEIIHKLEPIITIKGEGD